MSRLPVATRADRLASLLQDGVTTALAQCLLESEPLRPRLGALLTGRLGVPGIDTKLQRLAAMRPPEVDELCSHAGSVWHGAALLRLLEGGAVRALVTELGYDPRPIAARHERLAAPSKSSDAPLVDRIAADGRFCLAAWCASLAAPADRYAMLCLPPDTPPSGAHAAHGPRIIDALLSEASA